MNAIDHPGVSSAEPAEAAERPSLLKDLDYSVLQQCMHCGMCLPSCPTYDLTKMERNSPRGRIALMRAIADERISISPTFGEEMYFCLGCLACKTACPAGVDYPRLFEMARAEIERTGVLATPTRTFLRWSILKVLFSRQWLLHGVGRMLYLYRVSGLQTLLRKSGLFRLLPRRIRELEQMTPTVQRRFSTQLIAPQECPPEPRFTVGFLTGCVQDMLYADVNRGTADLLLTAGCRVLTPRGQLCCGSLHAHNGELELAREFARKLIDKFDLNGVDAIITNAGGCGSHLRHFDQLLKDDPIYAEKAGIWSSKLRDIHEWLCEIGFDRQIQSFKPKEPTSPLQRVTYHDSCHLCHGQGIFTQPRQLLRAIPGVDLVELPEASWCCGSAGIYNITQPETARLLAERKLDNILKTGCQTVATANPGCLLQLQKAAEGRGLTLEIVHPVSLLARALPQSHSHEDTV